MDLGAYGDMQNAPGRRPWGEPPPAAAPASQTYRLAYHGDGTAFFLLILKNVFLTLITLGIYTPWAKTERRKYIWSHVELDGRRFVYTGTGGELFRGYLKVVLAYAVFLGVPAAVGLASREGQLVVQFLLTIGFLILLPFAIYWSRAYLYSRTSFRGIRFGLAPGAGEYAGAAIGGYFLTFLTLGIYGPYWINNLWTVMTNRTRFGTESFHYDGNGTDVFWIYFKGTLLSIVTLGIYWFWMQAELQRYYFSHVTFADARGRCELTGGHFFTLFLLNLFGTTLTLGIAFPWITTYSLRVLLSTITFEGSIDFSSILKGASLGSATGDAMADVLDVDLGL
jgi:uncharacterized membrane protein YjgN (DUF898 family)